MTREYQPSLAPNDPACDPGAWDIVYAFATNDEMALPQAEDKLCKYLGIHFAHNDWLLALKAVMDAEGNTFMALNALDDIKKRTIQSKTCLTIKIPPQP